VLLPALPKTRQWQDTEVYLKLFYATKLKKIVDSETAGTSLKQTERMAKIREVAKREYDKESDEVKEQVRAKKEEPRNHKLTEDSMTPSSEQYQAAIDDLSYVVDTFLSYIRQTTGWTGFVVAGGPKPDIGGEIAIGSYVLSFSYL
jgi:hypothetical protein